MKKPLWLTRNIWTLSWVSMLQDVASEMLYPLLPVFLNTVLGAPALVIGILEGFAEGAMALTKLFSDKLNHFLPRKLMVFLGYGAAAVGKIIIALSLSWPFVLVGRTTDRIGKGIRSAPRDAILVRGSQPTYRGRIIGFHRSMDTAGAVIGPVLALLFLGIFDNNIRQVMWIAVVPAVVSTVLVLFIRDGGMKPGRSRPGTAEEITTTEKGVDSLHPIQQAQLPLSPAVRRLIAVLTVFSLVNFPDALLLLHLSLNGFSPAEVVGAYLFFNISYAVLSFPMGALADRYASKYIFAAGLICFAVTYAALSLSLNWIGVVSVLVIYGGFAAANDTVGKSWAAKLAPENQQLQTQAKLQGLTGFGILIAGTWAGLLWPLGGGNGSIPLIISAVIALVVAGYIALFAPQTSRRNP